jgi:hypothetical protein
MKKVFMSMIALMMAMSVNAQKYLNDSGTPFGEGKFYVGASFSGLGVNYSKATDWTLGLQAKGGYLFLDNWMLVGVFDYVNRSNGSSIAVNIGAGARYYFDQVGIYTGITAKYSHDKVSGVKGYDDFKPEIYAGYAFFLSHHVTIEPEIYYEHSFHDTDYSGFGLRLGFGYFF